MNIPVPIPVREVTTVKEAVIITGGLSRPHKMPGKAWGIPASLCKRGGKLREIAGAVCHECYARKGRFVFPNVAAAYMRRYQAYQHRDRSQWIQAMVFLINKQTKKDIPYFRAFDSGDLQDVAMLRAWIEVAFQLPHIHFWLVTRERGIVRRALKATTYPVPGNLLIRVSGDMMDDEGPSGFTHIGLVQSKTDLKTWKGLVKANRPGRWHCPAPLQGGMCDSCRACWDKQVTKVIYMEH
ncbi:MAG: hypothetical protein U9Q19_05440 [Pseudomonadota bacterium]|nr:hypothetical protein [Pseudomonadota bacterium]